MYYFPFLFKLSCLVCLLVMLFLFNFYFWSLVVYLCLNSVCVCVCVCVFTFEVTLTLRGSDDSKVSWCNTCIACMHAGVRRLLDFPQNYSCAFSVLWEDRESIL